MLFFQLLRVYFQCVLMDVQGAWQPHQAAESFVYIINEGGRAAAAVVLHSRRYTQPLLSRHMISS